MNVDHFFLETLTPRDDSLINPHDMKISPFPISPGHSSVVLYHVFNFKTLNSFVHYPYWFIPTRGNIGIFTLLIIRVGYFCIKFHVIITEIKRIKHFVCHVLKKTVTVPGFLQKSL